MGLLTLALVVLFAPLVGFLLQSAVGRRLPRQGDFLTIAAIGASLAASVGILLKVLDGETLSWAIPWLRVSESTTWNVSIHVDGLTAVMLVVVTLVSFLVHLFSSAYMAGDPKYWKFFAWLQMFSVSMLMLVLAGNLFHLFVGWELVGLCSYKLIGFWSEKQDPCNAARKAFITTRIGDLGMVAALMILYKAVGSLEFADVFAAATSGSLSQQAMTWSSLGLFAAAMGKSAQFPLHVWLPDAMEGPTPVSALIHAATMVAAGVYLVGRTYPLFTPDALLVVAVVGTVTAALAGLIAVAQNDIKKVLAYSTVSQLGFMFLGLGSGAWHAGLFHLTTHAFFKALMFLGSGSVIMACHHEQDMRKMGGLLRKMPITGWTFLIGVLAIAGLPFVTSGFFSKDAVLAGAWHRYPVLSWIGLAAAFLTAFYMLRLYAMTFLGKPKDEHVYEHAHESPWPMTVPLIVLGVLSVVAGYGAWHSTLLDPVRILGPGVVVGSLDHHEHSNTVMLLASAAGVGGLLFGFVVFAKRAAFAWKIRDAALRPLETAFANKFWFDEFYREFVLRPAYHVARFCAFSDAEGVDGAVNGVGKVTKGTSVVSGAIDHGVVDGAVRGTGAVVLAGGGGLSRMQSGRLRTYLALGVALVAVVLIVVVPLVRG
jgi:NADH-quinone oxidoreductase subunit L